VLCSPTAPVADLEERIATRRAAVGLVRLPRVELLLHEWLLRTPVHDARVMSEQLHHLIDLSVLPTMSIRIVPVGHSVTVCGGGPFTLLGFADNPPAVYREVHTVGMLLDHPMDVAASRSAAAQLDSVALDEQQSRYLIGRVAADLYADDELSSSPVREVRP